MHLHHLLGYSIWYNREAILQYSEREDFRLLDMTEISSASSVFLTGYGISGIAIKGSVSLMMFPSKSRQLEVSLAQGQLINSICACLSFRITASRQIDLWFGLLLMRVMERIRDMPHSHLVFRGKCFYLYLSVTLIWYLLSYSSSYFSFIVLLQHFSPIHTQVPVTLI